VLGISIKRRKKKPTKAQSQYAQDVAAQKAAENYASMAAAAASKYSQPPPAPAPAPVISEDPLGGGKYHCAHGAIVTHAVCRRRASDGGENNHRACT
jgi:hypothetical protein